MKLLEKGAFGIDRRGFEDTTTVYNLNSGLGKFGSWIGGFFHRNWGCDNDLLPLFGTTTPTPTLLLGGATTTLLLDVHHTPNNEDEYESVSKET